LDSFTAPSAAVFSIAAISISVWAISISVWATSNIILPRSLLLAAATDPAASPSDEPRRERVILHTCSSASSSKQRPKPLFIATALNAEIRSSALNTDKISCCKSCRSDSASLENRFCKRFCGVSASAAYPSSMCRVALVPDL